MKTEPIGTGAIISTFDSNMSVERLEKNAGEVPASDPSRAIALAAALPKPDGK